MANTVGFYNEISHVANFNVYANKWCASVTNSVSINMRCIQNNWTIKFVLIFSIIHWLSCYNSRRTWNSQSVRLLVKRQCQKFWRRLVFYEETQYMKRDKNHSHIVGALTIEFFKQITSFSIFFKRITVTATHNFNHHLPS